MRIIKFALPILLTSIALAQSAGTFTPTGSMTAPRARFRSTLLPSGKVLITGGNESALPSAELYDPTSGIFVPTGNMIRQRAGHTATLLPDGRVLIAGGSLDNSAEISAEIYDPATGTFTATGNMTEARVNHVAILLADGRILIAGGQVPPYTRDVTAELYDPVTGTFIATGSFFSGAAFGVVGGALLADGRVLMVPYYDPGFLGIYDPVTGTFTAQQRPQPPTSELDTAKGSAVLLANGKVLLAGGVDDPGASAYTELYAPWTGTFTGTGEMTTPRDGHQSVLLPEGAVLITGGENVQNFPGSLASAEVFDPALGTFSNAGSMNARRIQHTETLLADGTVLIAGGYDGVLFPTTAASAEIYRPAVLHPAPMLFSLSGDGQGQGAIWHSTRGDIASTSSPAAAGEVLSLYTTSLIDGGVIPPQVAIGGRLAEVLFFGNAPGYPGYSQVNFKVPIGVAQGTAVPVRLTYIGRSSNTVTIGVE